MSLVINDPIEIRLVRKALQRYRKEHINKKLKFLSGEWTGDVESSEDAIRRSDALIQRIVEVDSTAEATVSRRSRYA